MKHTEESKLKISIANSGENNGMFGKKLTPETLAKMSLKLKGKTSPMKGKHHSKETRLKMSDSSFFKGKKRPVRSKDWCDKISKAHKGKVLSEEHKRKLSIAGKGRKVKESTKEMMRQFMVAHPNRKFKDTKIELKVEKELIRRNIYFKKQFPLCKVSIVDFYLPEHKIAIQVDGCYYHNCPIHCPLKKVGVRIKDERQDKILMSNGYFVYRFWEHDINNSVIDCINRINL